MPEDKRPRILLIDDDEFFYELLQGLLCDGERVQLRWEATGRGGVETLEKNRFDLVIVDYQLPDMLGLEVFETIDKLDPRPHRVMMTGFGSINLAVDAMKRGADDFFTKPFEDPDALIRFVNRILKLAPPLPLRGTPLGATPQLASASEGDPTPESVRLHCLQLDPPVDLSLREAEIAADLARGLANKEIAADLHISEQTVKNHLSNIYRKFGVASRSQLIRILI